MKRPLGVALSVVALLCVVVVGLVFTGVWSPPWEAKATPEADGSIAVAQGRDVTLPSKDGSPEVTIPGSAISSAGKLHVKPVALPENRSGWAIELVGAQLTGEATLVFKGVVKDGEPAPLVGFTENPEDDPQYMLNAEVSGADLIVRTNHFSNWFTDSWDWLTNWARNKLDSVYKGSGYGSQPKCERESEARAGGVTVTSDSGGAVQWCVGKNADGSTVLKVNNSRGYAVSAESTAGLTLGSRSLDFGQMLPRLAKYITAPTIRGSSINIIGPGETVEYKLDSSAAVGVRLDPSPPAYLATALWFGIETTTMVYGKIFGKISSEAVSSAMDAANCAAGFQGMATADVTQVSAAGRYLNDAVSTVMACSGKVFMDLAKGKMLDILAVSVAQVFTWAWSGIQTAAHGLAAAADTALNFNGYRISISPPSAVDHTPLPATVTYSGTIENATFSFEHPLEWKVDDAVTGGAKITNARGEEMGELAVFTIWDANGAMKHRPVTNLPSTPGRAPLSETGLFVVKNVAMDLGPFPEELGMIKWPKPVQLSMSMSPPDSAPPKELVPFLLYGQVQVETGKLSIGGMTTRLVLFNSSKYFSTMAEMTAYTKTTEYQQIQSMLASFKG
ncbi:hypothetical protein F8G81_09520 [Arthrobacter sp. CDRTa11]|uniref:hypothetical protein n=1 Tax=Arthrobacter sp. CDRTa11 TaxID=2651199 RepID=UPI0022659194|nr:hypothetical protein [Arthrobacter sp. CDRTa11]UZX02823.1 hypothetical protein F8G81_09520 [Arthrobacter sp. CDRTa11]